MILLCLQHVFCQDSMQTACLDRGRERGEGGREDEILLIKVNTTIDVTDLS